MIDFEQWYEQEIGSENKPEYEAAKWAWEYQQKKLDCCREENRAHLKKIDELQARIDEVMKACDNLRKDIIRELHAEYDKGWKDCATSIYHQLKGNKDEN